MKKLPNYLTIARIVLVPFFILCYYTGLPGWNYWAGGIFIAASLTDMLDGYLARRFACVSKFGKLMDPIADKVLFTSALLLLLAWGKVGPVICIILIGREFTVSYTHLVYSGFAAVSQIHRRSERICGSDAGSQDH